MYEYSLFNYWKIIKQYLLVQVSNINQWLFTIILLHSCESVLPFTEHLLYHEFFWHPSHGPSQLSCEASSPLHRLESEPESWWNSVFEVIDLVKRWLVLHSKLGLFDSITCEPRESMLVHLYHNANEF